MPHTGANNTISQVRFTHLTDLLTFRIPFQAPMPYRYCRKWTGSRRHLNINTSETDSLSVSFSRK
jgi:hypothetical protein